MYQLNKKIPIAFILGINSGLPVALISSLLRVLVSDYKIDIAYIGLVSLVTIPFSFKYLWAPVMDNTDISSLSGRIGRRKGWIIMSQFFLIFFIILTGYINPSKYPYAFAISAVLLAFFSASSDIVIDAFRIEIFAQNEQGAGATSAIYGYRIGMIISGAGGIYLASHLSWCKTYSIMSLALIPGIFVVILAPFGKHKKDKVSKLNFPKLYSSFIQHIKNFIKQDKWFLILLFIAFYKLSDAYLGAMTMPFLVEQGYSKIEIATAIKTIGLMATILGSAVGGYLTYKVSMRVNLLVGEIIAMISNLPFLLLLKFHNVILLAIINGFENLTSAISNIALVVYISSVSKKKYTATYYAALTSFAMFGRSILSASSGITVSSLGWGNFFIFSALLSIPCFIIIYYFFLIKGWIQNFVARMKKCVQECESKIDIKSFCNDIISYLSLGNTSLDFCKFCLKAYKCNINKAYNTKIAGITKL